MACTTSSVTTSTTKGSTVTKTTTNTSASSTVESPPIFLNRPANGLLLDFQRGGGFSDAVVQDAIRRVLPLARQFAPRSNVGNGGIRSSLTSQTQVQSLMQSLGQTFDHEELSIITSTTFGPATILIGPDQSVTFFVSAGTVNTNTNTHTQSFFNEQIVNQTNTVTVNTLIFTSLGEPVIAQVDIGAIISLIHSGLPAALAQRGALQNIASVSTRDVNSRLFRLRTGGDERELSGGDKEPVRATIRQGKDGKLVLEEVSEPPHWLEIFAGGDFGSTDQDTGPSIAGLQAETWGGTVGAEFNLGRGFKAGLAWSHLESNGDLSGDLGGIGSLDLDGQAITAYLSWLHRGYYADALYSYGSFDHHLHRDTLLGSHASAETESETHSVQFNTGYNWHVTPRFVTGPMLSLDYQNGEIDGYTEKGGGGAAVTVSGQSYDSLISRVGWQATWRKPTGFGNVTCQVRAAWEHEYMNDAEEVAAGLATSPIRYITSGGIVGGPAFGLVGSSGEPERDWLAVGGGVQFEFNDRWSVLLDYEGRFLRGDRTDHFGSVRVSCKF